MDRRMVDRLSSANSERVLKRLTSLQHVRPALPLGEAVAKVCADEGLDLSGNDVDAHEQPIGRLTRAQICGLAERIEAQWQKHLGRAFAAPLR